CGFSNENDSYYGLPVGPVRYPMPPRLRRRVPVSVVAVVAVSLLLAGCLVGTGALGRRGKPSVVAAENFWGSLAAQLGGDRVEVTSIIRNPNADPHDYEPTAADARSMASAQLVIVNGMGYDPWAHRLL